MTRYSVQPRDRIFVKGYGFLSFARSMGKNIGEKISKSLSGKYSPGMLAMRQKLLEHAKQSATDAIKTSSKRVIQKTAKASGDLTGNKIANRTTKVSKNSHKIIQTQLQMSLIKKYLKKITYLQKKDKKLWMT